MAQASISKTVEEYITTPSYRIKEEFSDALKMTKYTAIGRRGEIGIMVTARDSRIWIDGSTKEKGSRISFIFPDHQKTFENDDFVIEGLRYAELLERPIDPAKRLSQVLEIYSIYQSGVINSLRRSGNGNSLVVERNKRIAEGYDEELKIMLELKKDVEDSQKEEIVLRV